MAILLWKEDDCALPTASYICLGGALERTVTSLYAYLLPYEAM